MCSATARIVKIMSTITMSAPGKTGAQFMLALGALGVVYGDIGTSPIYAFREALHAGGGAATWQAVAGCLSLMFWLVMVRSEAHTSDI